MKNLFDYSQYECPYSHLKKECGHELKGPEGFQDTYGVWCACGYRGPVFYLDPDQLGLKKKGDSEIKTLHDVFMKFDNLLPDKKAYEFMQKKGRTMYDSVLFSWGIAFCRLMGGEIKDEE